MFDAEAIIVAGEGALDLVVPDAYREAVARNVERLYTMAQPLLAFSFPVESIEAEGPADE